MLNKLLKFDWILLISVLLLLGIGLLSLYSISATGQSNGGLNVFVRQCVFSALGAAVMLFFAFSDYHYLKSYSTAIYFAMLFLLAAVLFLGSTVRGTVGWIGLGPFHIQPVEIAKLSLIIFLASFISQKKMELGETGRLIASLILTAAMIFLVLRQPDLGSAMVLAGIWLGMILISGISKRTLVILILAGAILASSGWIYLGDYQKARVISLVSPESDPRGSGYNVIQSMVAVGSGGLIGKGIGHGSQSQLNFLPEKHTDFIFAVVSEELGLFGSWLVIFLFLVAFYRIKRIASRAPDNFGYLLASGILIMYFIQVLVNIGMNIGIIPVTGIPLPFLSYGGSFLLTAFAALGILLGISGRREYSEEKKE
ncbi:MAG: rod shape-determining protein RodA [Candidatus Moranbacteria bacterium]|nr:rod shape-determining protein RodA [Candidatus Moranbacteria bacterium]